jgi:hypothetical protein
MQFLIFTFSKIESNSQPTENHSFHHDELSHDVGYITQKTSKELDFLVLTKSVHVRQGFLLLLLSQANVEIDWMMNSTTAQHCSSTKEELTGEESSSISLSATFPIQF